MTNYSHFLVCSLLLFCLGCSPEKEYVAKVKLLTLKEADIYDSEKVYDVIFDAEEQNIDSLKNKSHQLFLQGIDAYKNKKEAAKAVQLFKQSILTFPDAKAYYELGNAKLDVHQGDADLKEAENAYHVARSLNFKPLSMLYYKLACIANQEQKINGFQVSGNLSQAFYEGFSDTTLLYSDKYLQSFIATDEYKRLMSDILVKNKIKNNPEDLFDVYKKSFPLSNASFEIPLDKVDMKDYKQSISYDFAKFVPEMQNSSFGRDVSHDFIFVAKVQEKSNYTAVLYTSINYYGEGMQPVHTKLVTYDNDGNIISDKLFAGQFSAEKVKVGRIDGDEITLQDYKRIWEQPIDKVPFEENAVEKYELVSKATFRINEEGKIMEQSVPSNYMDSVGYTKN
jgi:hypothetical protein